MMHEDMENERHKLRRQKLENKNFLMKERKKHKLNAENNVFPKIKSENFKDWLQKRAGKTLKVIEGQDDELSLIGLQCVQDNESLYCQNNNKECLMNKPVRQFTTNDYADRFNDVFKSNCKQCNRKIKGNEKKEDLFKLDFCDVDCINKFYDIKDAELK